MHINILVFYAGVRQQNLGFWFGETSEFDYYSCKWHPGTYRQTDFLPELDWNSSARCPEIKSGLGRVESWEVYFRQIQYRTPRKGKKISKCIPKDREENVEKEDVCDRIDLWFILLFLLIFQVKSFFRRRERRSNMGGVR